MEKFNSKEEVFDYILKEFGNESKAVLVRGDIAKSNVKPFSTFNVEVFGNIQQPVYQIHLCERYAILIIVNFYDYKFGSLLLKAGNVKMLKGNYTTGLEEALDEKAEEGFDANESVVRNYQLLMENFFQFVRTGDEKDLEFIQEKLSFNSIEEESDVEEQEEDYAE